MRRTCRPFVLVVLAMAMLVASAPTARAAGVQVGTTNAVGGSGYWALGDVHGTSVSVVGWESRQHARPGPEGDDQFFLLLSVVRTWCDTDRDVLVWRAWDGEGPAIGDVDPKLASAGATGTVQALGSFAEFPRCADPDYENGVYGELEAKEFTAMIEIVATGPSTRDHYVEHNFVDDGSKTWTVQMVESRPATATGSLTTDLDGVSISGRVADDAQIYEFKRFGHAAGVCFGSDTPWPHCPIP